VIFTTRIRLREKQLEEVGMVCERCVRALSHTIMDGIIFGLMIRRIIMMEEEMIKKEYYVATRKRADRLEALCKKLREQNKELEKRNDYLWKILLTMDKNVEKMEESENVIDDDYDEHEEDFNDMQ
jgi:predicted RNase H-like nuclease (RuvC/YqgF family)